MAEHKDFSEDTKRKVLLWSDRHCCVCGKACGIDIEVAHIEAKGDPNIDNAIPVCYDCHANLGRYVDNHPRGNKYKIDELKQRREQIYERYTSKLIPALLIRMNQTGFKLPRVGCSVAPVGRFIPVRAKVTVTVFLGEANLGIVNGGVPYYGGNLVWNLNPGVAIYGNFTLPGKCIDSKESLKLQFDVTCIDPYEREHKLLPECFTYIRGKGIGENEVGGYWFIEPASFNELKKFIYPR